MKTITTFAKWQVRDGYLEEVLALLPPVIKASLEEDGNQAYELYQSNSDENMLVLFERYSSEEALNLHRASDHFQSIVVQKIVPLLENREVILTSLVTP